MALDISIEMGRPVQKPGILIDFPRHTKRPRCFKNDFLGSNYHGKALSQIHLVTIFHKALKNLLLRLELNFLYHKR